MSDQIKFNKIIRTRCIHNFCFFLESDPSWPPYTFTRILRLRETLPLSPAEAPSQARMQA